MVLHSNQFLLRDIKSVRYLLEMLLFSIFSMWVVDFLFTVHILDIDKFSDVLRQLKNLKIQKT